MISDRKDKIMNGDKSEKIPNQKELEKELSEYLSKKYGNRVKIISPVVFPKTEEILIHLLRPPSSQGRISVVPVTGLGPMFGRGRIVSRVDSQDTAVRIRSHVQAPPRLV